MIVQHNNLRSTSLSTSAGPVEIDAEGKATVDEKLADHILSNPFGFTAVGPATPVDDGAAEKAAADAKLAAEKAAQEQPMVKKHGK